MGLNSQDNYFNKYIYIRNRNAGIDKKCFSVFQLLEIKIRNIIFGFLIISYINQYIQHHDKKCGKHNFRYIGARGFLWHWTTLKTIKRLWYSMFPLRLFDIAVGAGVIFRSVLLEDRTTPTFQVIRFGSSAITTCSEFPNLLFNSLPFSFGCYILYWIFDKICNIH